jgi:hypothetical protein
MPSKSPRPWLPIVVLGLALPLLGLAEPPNKDAAKKGMPSLDQLKLPAGAVLVVCDKIQDALRLVPKAVVLTPEKYQELIDRIAALEKQVKPGRQLPNVCKLTGKVEGDQVHLQIDYRFRTDKAGAQVFLGCQGTQPTRAALDPGDARPEGQLPLLVPVNDGLVVQVADPGDHRLSLWLRVPVGVRAAGAPGAFTEKGFELNLPGAAVTTLELTLPAAVKELRWNDRNEARADGGPWTLALGSVKNAAFAWREPIALAGAGALLTADAQITVEIDEQAVQQSAVLTLQDLRGQAKEWQVWVPAGAQVQLKSAATPAPRLLAAGASLYRVVLDQPTNERLQLEVQHRQPRRPRVPVGPFTVAGTPTQQGAVLIKTTPEATRGVRLEYVRPRGVLPHDVTEEQRRQNVVAVFQYGTVAAAPPPKGAAPLLEVELQPVRGVVEARVEHTLRLRPAETGWQVQATTRIQATPLHTGVGHLDVQLPRPRLGPLAGLRVPLLGFPAAVPWPAPAGGTADGVRVPVEYAYEADGAAVLARTESLDDRRQVRLHLTRDQFKRFTVTLTGTYFLPLAARTARLELPRPLGALDRGGKVTVLTEGPVELLPVAGAVPAADRRQQTAVAEQMPGFAELAWRPYRPDFPVEAVADVELYDRHAWVRQRWTFPAADGAAPAGLLHLTVPEAAEGFTVVSGGRSGRDAGRDAVWVQLQEPAKGSRSRQERWEPLVVEYTFALPPRPSGLPSRPRAVAVPLAWPQEATRVASKVRVWCPAGATAMLAEAFRGDTAWKDQGTEAVPQRDSLPALVVRGEGSRLPLRLAVLDAAAGPLAGVVVERVLMQVLLEEGGSQYYRARFRLGKVHARTLDVELPAPVAEAVPGRATVAALEVLLDGKKVPWRLLGGQRGVRLTALPADAGPAVLEIAYRLTSGPLPGGGPRSAPAQTFLYPPALGEAAYLGRVRWQIDLAGEETALSRSPAEGLLANLAWDWRGWLFTPRPVASGADLESWLTGSPGGDTRAYPGLAAWQTNLAPLRVWHLPRQVWLLVCSLLCLAVGMVLAQTAAARTPLARLLFWATAVGLAGAVGAALLFWPGLLAMLLYGAQPGAVVLVLVLVVQWLMHQRYRRQVVFMPGFTRVQAGSSLIRSSNVPNRPREPSTIDQPTAPSADQ